MRRVLAFVPLCLVTLVAACSSSSNTKPVGPVFDANDGTPDVVTDHVPDTGRPLDAHADHTSTSDGGGAHDGGMTAPEAGATDTGAPHDAGVDATDGARAPKDASDSSPSAPDAGLCPNGTGTIALTGGTSTLAFGAVSVNGAPFAVHTFPMQSVTAAPAIVALGGGAFLSVYPTTGNDVIMSTSYTSGNGWTAPVSIEALAGSDAAATERGGPSLAVIGSSAELVYYGSNTFFYHGVYSAGAWGPASDAVGGTVSQDFGPSQPSAAAAGSTLSVAYDGMNGGLYVDTWTAAGGWAGAGGILSASVGTVPPTLVALTGGTDDLMLVYVQKTTNFLYSVVHSPQGGWGVPTEISSTATATTQVSLAPLASGGVAMVYEGTNGLPYGSVYTPGASTPWSAPVSVDSTSGTLPSPPTIAPAACGVDAIAALVEAAGVTIVTLKGGAWSSPVLVDALPEMTYASVAVVP